MDIMLHMAVCLLPLFCRETESRFAVSARRGKRGSCALWSVHLPVQQYGGQYFPLQLLVSEGSNYRLDDCCSPFLFPAQRLRLGAAGMVLSHQELED